VATCGKCHYKCFSCVNTDVQCKECTRVADPKRIMNIPADPTADHCPCLAGYYDSGTAICVICVHPCLNCVSKTECTTCVTGLKIEDNR